MKLLNVVCPGIVGCLMLMTAHGSLAQSPSTLTLIIAQTQNICDPVTSYLQTVNSSSDINTAWVPVTLIGVCTNAAKGYNLSVSSAQGGQLQIGTNTQYVMPYQVRAVCASSANGFTPTRTDVCSVSSLINTFFSSFQPSGAFQKVYDTPGCSGITGPDRAACNQAFNSGVQVGLQIKLNDSIKSTGYPGGTYTDTVYYTLQAN